MTEKLKFEPKEVSDVMLAFPANVCKEHLPAMEQIPEVFKCEGHWEHPTTSLVNNLAYGKFRGAQVSFRPREGLEGEPVWRHILACLRSFEPKHEHKIAGVAYLIDEWIDVFYVDGKVAWYNKDRVLDPAILEKDTDG